MKSYSIQEGLYKNNPTIEVLVDGNEWGSVFDYDEHFRFGLRKAQMVLDGMLIIEEFSNSEGAKPPLEKIIQLDVKEFEELIECIRHDEFKYYNKVIEKPYLTLIGNNNDFSFGLEKAKALILLEDEIRDFVNKHAQDKY